MMREFTVDTIRAHLEDLGHLGFNPPRGSSAEGGQSGIMYWPRDLHAHVTDQLRPVAPLITMRRGHGHRSSPDARMAVRLAAGTCAAAASGSGIGWMRPCPGEVLAPG